jgi:uncharacterized protein YndB with AHSA1/START domain
MRYADGPTAKAEVHIDAPPSRVWELVCDIDLPAKFSTEFQGARWLDDAPGPAVGARFEGTNQHPRIGTWTTTSFVVECEAERVFAWNVTDPDEPSASWRFELEPDGAGTRLRQWMRMGPGRSGLNIAIDAMPDREEEIISRRQQEHASNMTVTLDGIKKLAESAGA